MQTDIFSLRAYPWGGPVSMVNNNLLANSDFLTGAFELNSIDYLLKPVNPEKLQKSIQKYQKLAVHVGSKIISLETRLIAYFYSMEKSTFCCTKNNQHYPLDFSLEYLEQLLDPELFFRINRKVILHCTSIEKIHILSRSRVKVETHPPAAEDLLVSTARTHAFRLWLDR